MTKLSITESSEFTRFDAYRVQPVVETTAPDGINRSYQAFRTLAEAQAEMKLFDSKPTIDGAEGQQILWSLYGMRQGIAEQIGDRTSEAGALALLYAISGIPAVAGQSEYRLPQLWIVVHEHRFGPTARVVANDKQPTERQLVRSLNIQYETRSEDPILVYRVDRILVLDWQESDSEPLE